MVMLLSAALVGAPIPAYAGETAGESVDITGLPGAEMPAGAVSGNTAGEKQEEEEGKEGEKEGEKEAALPDQEGPMTGEAEGAVFAAPDWRNMSDAELTDYFFGTDEQAAAEWLAYMPYDDFAELIQRDTWLTEETTVQTYGNAYYSEENGGVIGELVGEETMPYYESILKRNGYGIPSEGGLPAEKASYFGNSKGNYYYKAYSNGTAGQTVSVNISGLSTKTSITDTDSFGTMNVTVSSTGAATGGSIAVTIPEISSSKNSTHGYLLRTLTMIGAGSSDSRTILTANVAVSKSAGYAVLYSKTNKSGTFKCATTSAYTGAEYAGDANYTSATTANLTSFTSITENSSVGKDGYNSTQSGAQSYVFNFVPAKYHVSYNGNGATGGTAPADQMNIAYGTAFALAGNGYTKAYTVSFDMNDSDNPSRPAVPVAAVSAPCGFTGWKGSDGKTYAAGQKVSSLTTANGSTVTMAAQWGGADITLPGASREGYTFTGWSWQGQEQNEKNKVAGQSHGVTSDTTLTANWVENDVSVDVYHYIQRTPKGEYELFDTVHLEELPENIDYVFPVSEAAIAEVNKTAGCHCVRPAVQSIAPTEGLIVEYYYDCVADAGPNNYYNTYGWTDEQVRAILTAIEKNGLAKIKIDGVEYTIVRNADGTFSIKVISNGKKEVVTVPSYIKIGDTVYTITDIGNEAFKDNATVKQVFISSGIVTVGDYAFYNCRNLARVEMPDTVMRIGKYAFGKCPKLSTVRFSSGCYEMGEGVFSGCTGLKNISLSGKLAAVPKKAFYGCTALKKVTIGGKVTSIGDLAFYNCRKLSGVSVPSRVQKIGKKAFYRCSSLKKVTFRTKGLRSIGESAFKKCGDGIKFKVPNRKLEDYKKLLKGKY